MHAWNPQANDIFLNALEIPALTERQAFIAQACSGSGELLAQVESLIAASHKAGSFLDGPAPGLDATLNHLPLEQLGAQIGPYKLLQQIGEGGMGVVYMAEQSEPVERRVALKIIKPGMDSRQVVARFEAERQALAMMDHPNIAKVLEAGTTTSGRPYFVMELVKGIPITRYCDEKHLSLQQRLELVIPVCQAIQHAHQKGIIHRDIKPNNVLVAQYDGRPVPKVIDFGVAKATAQKLTERTMFTELGQIVGTLEYMSPEQAELNQLDIDTRSDIYSLGVLLYELLAGTTPFDKQKLRSAAFHEMLRIIREDEPPKPSTSLSTSGTLPSISANRQSDPSHLSKAVRGELDWIVMKALEKDRNRRYETANGLASDIQRYLNDEHVQACPPSARYRFGKFARKNRATLTTAAVVALVLLIGTGVSTWQAIRATNAEAHARANETQANEAAKAERAAKEAETVQRKRAETGERQAEENFESALEAVDRLLAHIGTKELNEVPRVQNVRRKILEDAISHYEKLRLKSENSAAIRFRMGNTLTNMARLCVDLGDYDAAERAYEPALAMLDQLVAEDPTRKDYRFALAQCLYQAGHFRMWVIPDQAKMETLFQKAIDHFQKLAEASPDSGYDFWIANAENILIRSRVADGGRDEAIAHTRRLISRIEESGNPTARGRGEAWRQLAELLATVNPVEADNAVRRAIVDYREDLRVNKSMEGRNQFAQLLNFAGAHLMRRFADEARENLGEGATLVTALIDDYPTNPHFRMQLAWNLRNQARLSVIQAQEDAAKEDPEIATNFLAEANAKYDKAIQTVRQLVTDFPRKQTYRKALVEFVTEHSTHLRQLATGETAKLRPEEAAAQIIRAEKLMDEAQREKRRLEVDNETEAFRRAGETSKAERQAFIILGSDGVADRKFDTLAAAVQGSRAGDGIEVRGNGPFANEPIKIKHSLSIRAGTGYRPVITLSTQDPKAYALLETDAPLVLEGLELQAEFPSSSPGHEEFLLRCSQVFYAANCRFLSVSLYGFESRSPVCELQNCEFIGSVGIWRNPPSGARLAIRNCLNVAGELIVFSSHVDYAKDSRWLQLTRNTFVTTSGLVRCQHLPEGSLQVEAAGNVFDAENGVVTWLLGEGFSRVEAESFVKNGVSWRGQGNLFAIATREAWLGPSPWAPRQQPEPERFIENLADWKTFWKTAEPDSLAGSVRYEGGDLRSRLTTSPEKLTPEDFRLHAASAGCRGGLNGKDLGADIDLVGPGAAYERWKKTPEYQQWLQGIAEPK